MKLVPEGSHTALWWLVIVLSLAHGTLYAAALPAWSFADEHQHFDYAERIAIGKGLPVVGETLLLPEVAQSVFDSQRWQKYGWPARPSPDPATWGFEGFSYEAHQPPLYYVILSIPLRILPGDIHDRLFASRLLMVLLSLVTLVCLSRTVLTLWPKREDLAFLACLLLVFIPERTHSIARVNNDGLAEALGALVILAATQIAVHGIRQRNGLTLGILLGLAVLTKPTCIGLGLPVVAAFWLHRSSPEARRALWLTVIAAALLVGPVLTVAWSHSGALDALSEWDRFKGKTCSPDPKSLVRSLLTLYQSFWFYQKFWDVWRYGDFARSWSAAAAFWSFGTICVAAGINWIRIWRNRIPETRLQNWWNAVLALTVLPAIVMQLSLLLRELMLELQGRLLLPYLVAVLTVFVGAYTGRWGRLALLAGAGILFLTDVVWLLDGQILWFYARSPYAQDALAELGGTGSWGWLRLVVSDKPGWIVPFVPVAAIAYASALVALGWIASQRPRAV